MKNLHQIEMSADKFADKMNLKSYVYCDYVDHVIEICEGFKTIYIINLDSFEVKKTKHVCSDANILLNYVLKLI